jgi:hypothetical protein
MPGVTLGWPRVTVTAGTQFKTTQSKTTTAQEPMMHDST